MQSWSALMGAEDSPTTNKQTLERKGTAYDYEA
jgi:hypothetical protein